MPQLQLQGSKHAVHWDYLKAMCHLFAASFMTPGSIHECTG